MPVARLGVVGTGLIGASIALAAKRAGVPEVAGWDADPASLAVAAERGAVDVASPSLGDAVAGAELAVVAVPVAVLPDTVSAVLAAAGGATVTDVGSTKAAVCAAAAGSDRFIGGHPVSGSEAQGPAHAAADLFEGATWFLTPLARTDAARYEAVHRFVVELGAVPLGVEPDAHDRIVAVTSHLPHALANLLLNQVGGARIEGHEALAAAGGSLRDMTRVAGANPRIWVDILLANADPVLDALREHRRRLEQLERALADGDAGFLARWIGEAAGNRRRMLSIAHADVGALQQLRVHVPDRPGVLAGITQALGAERINIEEFALEHLSPERGGTLRLLVAGDERARRAAAVLEAQGYGVVVSPVVEER